ncbi:MAG: epoxide hydrolase [Sporichthyaceae bacterium]|nr:epoxide hydrolase [Sporichthyaceae bacterium]
MPIEPFTIRVDDAVLADLTARIRNTRWPDQIPGIGWDQGTDLDYLKPLLGYWADGFDWRAQERKLNGYQHFRVELDGVRIHFVHAKARHGDGIPLVLTHGWPSAFVELLDLVPLLTDPAGHGIDGPAFDLVLPSLPGYGCSERPARIGINYRYVAQLWHRMMGKLGYHRYGAGGGDFGAGVASYLALDYPDSVLAVHLSNLELYPYLGPGSAPLSLDEQRYVDDQDGWAASERGYSAIQSTKPQTLGYGLTDSPAGLAAWILEKWRTWTDSGGDLERRFTRDFLLTLVTLYWVTGTITPSMRDYWDNRWHPAPLGPDDFVDVPTGVAVFATEFAPEGKPPREWAERLYRVQRWTPMLAGGHFAPAEEPLLLARDIAGLFASLDR